MIVRFNEFDLGEVESTREADLLIDCIRESYQGYTLQEAPEGSYTALVDGLGFATLPDLKTAERLITELYEKKYYGKGKFYIV